MSTDRISSMEERSTPSRLPGLILAAAAVAPIAAPSAAGADDLLAVGMAGDIFTIDSRTGQRRERDERLRTGA